MRPIILLLANTISLLFALAMNALSGSSLFEGKTVGEVSRTYDTLFAPAGYAFAIWGLIYLLLVLFVGYQWFAWRKHKQDRELQQTGLWLAVANLANGFWIAAWLTESIGVSVLLMLVLLISLLVVTARLRLEVWDPPLRIVVFVWWPIVVYLGWIIVASVANVAAWLVSIGRNGMFISASAWTIALIALSTVIYLVLVWNRNMREAALVGIWALIAIAVRQWQAHFEIAASALIGAAILLAVTSWHAIKHWETSPPEKLKRGEI
jgi:cbb3-type cytochrome oxidase subunit 3